MRRFADTDDPRREFLLELLALGWLSTGLLGAGAHAQGVFGRRPGKLPADQSVYRISGHCSVNEQPATLQTRIGLGDSLRTGKDSEFVFVVGTTSMLMRGDSHVVLQAAAPGDAAAALRGIRLRSGKLLSVFAPGARQIETSSAIVRVSGTGVYLEADPEQTYFCTCYGVAQVAAVDDPTSTESVVATHHDKPLVIVAGNKNPGNSIRRAAFVNHTDQELALIETLVGRRPPFALPKSVYEQPTVEPEYGR